MSKYFLKSDQSQNTFMKVTAQNLSTSCLQEHEKKNWALLTSDSKNR